MDHEEYYSSYNNLSNMIIQAYTMLYLIEEIDVPPEPFLSDEFNVIGYIDQILRYMLGLTIWQICYDTNPKANTIQHLHRGINGRGAKTPSIPIKKALETDLNNLRKKYLAHNDKEKPKGVKISIDDLACLLNELRIWLNSLCNSQLDNRVSEITDDKLKILKETICTNSNPLLGKRNGIRRDDSHV